MSDSSKKRHNSSTSSLTDNEEIFTNSNKIDDAIFQNCKQSRLKIVYIHKNDLKKIRFNEYFDSKSTTTTTTNDMTREHTLTTASPSISYHENVISAPQNSTPNRVFKIVFIGDSGVGKTSFVQRFCNNTFRETFSTTIGVDFQVKSILVDGRIIALQFWDTAGQERYRSITKQYFRKADGVICMYDITSEQSFKNCRNWITSMRECASDECLLTIIGNKIDLCENEDCRVVKHKDGAKLADEHGALFFETSSKQSKNLIEAIEAIARILQEKEDKQIEDVLNLRTREKKKKCC